LVLSCHDGSARASFYRAFQSTAHLRAVRTYINEIEIITAKVNAIRKMADTEELTTTTVPPVAEW
jgi:hypothetical protein